MIYPDFYPFYATQGSPGFYNEEREQEKEFDLMRSYYPDTARRIQEKAEAQCQLLDYEGSRLYDEYPDSSALSHLSPGERTDGRRYQCTGDSRRVPG